MNRHAKTLLWIVALALVAIGPAAIFDAGWTGVIALALKACAAEVSQRLGARAH